MTKILFTLLTIALLTTGLTAQKTGTAVGQIAPEISGTTPDGKNLKISDLKGKLVLIDFWASWCSPCRRENPNVVKAWKKYKDAKFKNGNEFAVFSVSLDKNEAQWKKAIKDDNLNWKYHISDLKGWASEPASKYGVRSIPTSFLIDKNGKIVAKNLRGQNLENTLNQLLIKK